jgi:hypothetical protein
VRFLGLWSNSASRGREAEVPVKRRTPKVIYDYPRPWEDRPISRERWERHRERMLADTHPGHRPEEWWLYDRQELRPPKSGEETIALYERGELSAAEIAALTPMWRGHFERAQEPGFAYCQGPRSWLKGADARSALYHWAGIPAEVVGQFENHLCRLHAEVGSAASIGDGPAVRNG